MNELKNIYNIASSLIYLDAHQHAKYEIDKIKHINRVGSKKFNIKASRLCQKQLKDGFLVYRGEIINKSWLYIHNAYITPVKTPKGILYCTKRELDDGTVVYRVFTAHVFDQYKNRVNDSANRTRALSEFFGDYLSSIPTYDKNGVGVKLFTNQGVALGLKYSDPDQPNVTVEFYKTFITLEMLRNGQKNLLHDFVKTITELTDVRRSDVDFSHPVVVMGRKMRERWSNIATSLTT